MHLFQLPKNTTVGRVIPKNAFDDNINSRQKKQFTDLVQRITWTNKLSSQTINLRSVDVEEIQIFVIELKKRDTIDEILKIINKHIPYHIICWIEYDEKSLFQLPTNISMSLIMIFQLLIGFIIHVGLKMKKTHSQ